MFYEHYDQVPMASWRWRHFAPREIASKGDGSILIDEDALDKLE
jgi:zinc D-Ala-D-Ala carboxypeptidase